MTLNADRRFRFGGVSDPPDRLALADNLGFTAALPDGAVDLVYLDPPFGTGGARRARAGAYADGATDPETIARDLLPCLAESRRVLAATGSLFVHLDQRAVHYVKVALDRLFGVARFVNEIVWCYSVGGKGRRGFGKKHDTILWYARSADYAFFPDAVRVPRKGGSHMRVVRDDDGRQVQVKTDRRTGRIYRYPLDRGKLPEDWWTDIETLNRGDRERLGWPTQKPARLLERLVAAAAPPGGLVGDWFAGSGTTAAVAQRTGRRFASCDREPAAVALAARRLVEQGAALAGEGRAPPDLVVDGVELRSREAVVEEPLG